jgi:hypothetical protein
VPPKTIKFDTDKHEYVVDGEKVPGVTTIIGKTMPKDALTWWGMRVGIASVIRLLREHDLSWPVLQSIDPDHVIDPLKIPPGEGHFTKSDRKRQKPRTLVEVMVVDNKLSTNHIRDQRGSVRICARWRSGGPTKRSSSSSRRSSSRPSTGRWHMAARRT